MSLSGAILSFTDNYILMVLAAFVGTINVTGSETGAFLSIEQAILPQTVKDIKKRNTIFGLYNMMGTFAMSAGILLLSLPMALSQEQYFGFNQVESIRPLFSLYSVLGISLIITYSMISKEIEVEPITKTKRPIIQTLSPRSKQIVAKLSALFAIDSFAGGFVIQSIVSLWFYTRFGADLTTLSYIFSAGGRSDCSILYCSSQICGQDRSRKYNGIYSYSVKYITHFCSLRTQLRFSHCTLFG